MKKVSALIVSLTLTLSLAATPVQLESWCNTVNEYWTSHEDWTLNPLPICHEVGCRPDIYDKWARDCELTIIKNTAERCRSKLESVVQEKYGPPREQQIRRVMCNDDCVKYQNVMEEALARSCCENNCTHAHPLGTDKACYENMLEMTNEILGVSKSRIQWVVLCSSSVRLVPSYFFITTISLVVLMNLLIMPSS